jgi:hypothetical protein
MTMTRSARITAVAGALLLSTLLAACGGPTDPSASDSPAPDPSGSPTSTAGGEGDGGGESEHPLATDATCADLVPADSLRSLFSTPVAPVGPERTSAYIATNLDAWWVAEAAGGLACEWQDATSLVTSEGMYDYRGVRVLLAPAAHAGFSEYSHQFASPGDDVSDCSVDICTRDVYLNGWWLSLFGMGFENAEYLDHAMRQYDAIVERVRALPAPTSIPHTSSLTDDCVELLPADRIGHAFDVPASAVQVDQENRNTFRDNVLASLGGMTCYLSVNGTELGIVETLPSGAWAQRDAVAAYLELGGTEQQIDIPGVDEPGSLREQVDASGFDVAVDGDWIKLIIWPSASYPTENIAYAVANAIVGVG